MIQSLTESIKNSLILKAFLGLMVISFGVWGIGDVVSPSADPNVAIKAGSFEVRATELQRRFSTQLDRLRQNLGDAATRDVAVKASVIRGEIDQLSRLASSTLAANELGIVVTPDRIRESVLADNAFHDETGKFSQLTFQQILAQNGLDELRFMSMIKDDMTQQTLLRPVAVGAAAPKELVDRLFEFRTETRIADTVLVKAENMEIPDAPTDEQLKQTYDQNISLFTAPEYRKVEAVVLIGTDLVPVESVSLEEARAFYDENAAQYGQPEKRRIQQIIFESREQAEAARASASPGDGLAAVADKAGAGAPIDMGERAPNDPVLLPFGEAANGAVGEISQPVESPLGWHLVEVVSISQSSQKPFESVANEIRLSLAQDKAMDAIYDASVKLEDDVAAGVPMPDIARDTGGRYVVIDAVDANGFDPSGVTVPNIVDKAIFLSKTFSLQKDRESELMEVDGGYYIVRVADIVPAAPKPLELVRPEVTSTWQRLARKDKAREVAQEIASRLDGHASMAEAADSSTHATYAQLGPITRFGVSLEPDYIVDTSRISPEFVEKLFAAKVSDIVTAQVVEGYVVGRLKEIIPAKPDGDLASTEAEIATSTQQAMANDLLIQFSNALAARYPVTVNQEVVDQMIGAQP